MAAKPAGVREKLRALQLVQRATQVLEQHLGVGDRTLAEFVLDQARAARGEGPAGLQAALKGHGCEVPRELAQAVVGLVERHEREAAAGGAPAPRRSRARRPRTRPPRYSPGWPSRTTAAGPRR